MEPSHSEPSAQAQTELDLCHKDQKKRHRHHSGYVYVVDWEHPLADVNGRVLEHRLVMERYLGRPLLASEIVHHKNSIRDDNRTENLEVCSSIADHMRRHRKRDDPQIVAAVLAGAEDPKARISDMPVSKQLVSAICRKHGVKWKPANQTHLTKDAVLSVAAKFSKIEDAARQLGVSKAHLYMNFSGCFQKRKPPGFLDAHKEEICKMAMSRSTNHIAAHFGTTRTSVLHAFRRWRESDGLPTELVQRLNACRRRKKKL